MPDHRKAYYAREPRPAIVRILLDLELLREGGRESLLIADRIVTAWSDATMLSDPDPATDPVQAVADHIDREALGMAGEDAVQDAARRIVALIEAGETP